MTDISFFYVEYEGGQEEIVKELKSNGIVY